MPELERPCPRQGVARPAKRRNHAATSSKIPLWLRLPVHLTLPMTNLLSEERFLVITRASLNPFPWTNHLTALAYGLNYALVCFLLAAFLFQYRSLTKD